jgi:hypothetical protein
MSTRISRVGVVAKPAHNHLEYREWERARIIIFVQADERDSALAKARDVLSCQRWQLLSIEFCDHLIEDAVRAQGGEVNEMFNEAWANGSAFKVFPENFAAGWNGIPAIRPPRIGEAFIDLVVADICGQRLPTDEQNRIVDYRISNWIFELKDLQEEGLLQPERQKKLAELFASHAVPNEPIFLDPSILTAEDQRKFFDILSSPIKTQVKSASKQIRSTKLLLGDDTLRGGIIYLNTGYGSFPDEHFGNLVERYVRKDTTQIEAILAISTWAATNGFDTNILFRSYPVKTPLDVVNRLKEAFSKRFEEAMTKLITGQMASGTDYADPLTPVAFRANGLDFAWVPPVVPLQWAAGKAR